jgi:hypothetical protein
MYKVLINPIIQSPTPSTVTPTRDIVLLMYKYTFLSHTEDNRLLVTLHPLLERECLIAGSDLDRYIIRNPVDSIFNIVPVFMCRW